MKITYQVHNPGEPAAGLNPYSETITIEIESGDPGGESGEFAHLMQDFLIEWFDGASVYIESIKLEGQK